MQRVVRGHLGRKKAKRLRFLYVSARTIQCWARCLIAWRIAGERYAERAMLDYYEDKTPFGLLRELHRRREESKKQAATFVTKMHSAHEAAERQEAAEKIPIEELVLDPTLIGVSRHGPEERLAGGLKSPYAVSMLKSGKRGKRGRRVGGRDGGEGKHDGLGLGAEEGETKGEASGPEDEVAGKEDQAVAKGRQLAPVADAEQEGKRDSAKEKEARGIPEEAEQMRTKDGEREEETEDEVSEDSVALPLPPPGWKERISMELAERLKARKGRGGEVPAAEAALQENKLRDFGSFGGNFSGGRGVSRFEMIGE